MLNTRKKILKAIAGFCYRHHLKIIIAALLITVISVYFSLKLEVSTEIIDLLPKDSPVVKTFRRTMSKYGSMDYLIVVIEDKEGEKVENWESFTEGFAGALEEMEEVRNVDYRISDRVRDYYRTTFYDYALLYLDKQELRMVKKKLTGESITEEMRHNRRLLETTGSSSVKELIKRDPLRMREVFDKYIKSARGKLKIRFRDGYYFSRDLKMMLMLVKPERPAQDMKFVKSFLKKVKNTEKRVKKKFDAGDLKISYTGNYAIASSYSDIIKKDILITFLTSFLGVMILFIVTFRRAASLIYVGLPLLMGVLWTLSLAYLLIGSLNLVTSAFCAVLIGLGVDFAIHLFNKYALEKADGKEELKSIELALTETGNGIMTGAFTTAFAFYAMMVTDFRGLYELGFMTGTGIILCLVSMFFVMPSLLVFRSRFPIDTEKFKRIQNFGLSYLVSFVKNHRRVIIAAGVIITVFMGVFSYFVEFDDNFKHLRPDDNKPLRVQRHLVEKIGSPLRYTLLIAEGKNYREILRKADSIGKKLEELIKRNHVVSYNSLRTFIPPIERQKRNIRWLKKQKKNQPALFDSDKIKKRFKDSLEKSGFNSFEPFQNSIEVVNRALKVDSLLTVEKLKEAGVGDLVSRFLSKKNGSYELVTYVYPNLKNSSGRSIDQLVKSFEDMPDVKMIGMKILGRELKRIVERDTAFAAVLALLGVFGFMFYHFRGIKIVGLAVLPLCISVLWLIGTMSLLRIHFNLINICVLPIIIGIGIDDGIHIVHHYLEDAHRNVVETATLTGRAVIITSLTTIVGFGSLLFANYPGIASVGVVSILGVFYALLATVTLLPALLVVFERGW